MVGVNFIEEDTWPTHEMETRGNAWGLLTGICIAIPSGMAVALSILRYVCMLMLGNRREACWGALRYGMGGYRANGP